MTPKQQRFCDEYLKQKNPNGKQAAIKAGYAPKSAESMASQLLRNIKVKEYIERVRGKVASKVELTAERIAQELKCIGFGKIRDVMEWGPTGVRLRESSELSEDQAAMVSEVSETTTKDGGSLKLKVHDKTKALELLGKTLGMFGDGKLAVSGEIKTTGGPDLSNLNDDELSQVDSILTAALARAAKPVAERGQG